ncbi:PadR family transcriptional regulator [cf. Phormidesmis sp. LEGE 11477]|uniref:PadR family transcriptional regulator n=1 Tax=cf. Phormidesmis sp. LEGE 11477 TaxID=1828680 RepID=UPI0018815754|nr:PadR family transcriptional regulator [cf. Phormidesmis sp. LEGE 11477]MBE9060771.1 PadR family transcriptional regulator [cf. Phormidesmis sp. LEGE 11477]
MALSHTILALLSKQPDSGYDISKHFDEELSCYWKATQQQVYRELGKLTKNGWVNFEAVPQAGKPDKKIYCITEGGWRELTRWYTEPTEPTPIREDLLVKVLIGHKMPRQLLVNEVKHRQQIHSAQLKEYREIETEYLSRDSLGNSDRDLEAQFKYLTLKRGIAYETSWLSWCEDVMAMVNNLEGEGKSKG